MTPCSLKINDREFESEIGSKLIFLITLESCGCEQLQEPDAA